MPIATPEAYVEMLDRAKAGGFAYPGVNVTSSETLNAALRGFADAGSDGIVQISTGGAAFRLIVGTYGGRTAPEQAPDCSADAAGISFTDLAAHLTDRAVARRPR